MVNIFQCKYARGGIGFVPHLKRVVRRQLLSADTLASTAARSPRVVIVSIENITGHDGALRAVDRPRAIAVVAVPGRIISVQLRKFTTICLRT